MFKELIYIKKNSLTPKFCKDVINKFEVEPQRKTGMVGGNAPRIDKSVKDTVDFSLTRCANWIEEDRVFFDALQIGLEEYTNYLQSFHMNCMPNPDYKAIDTGYKIQKYEPSGFYKWHNDWVLTNKEGSRVFVFMWYLNTIDETDGGYTEFFDGTRLQPECGALVFFPATWTYVHRGYKTKVNKYLCNGWIYAKP